ncbi:hypothetical protein CDAR_418791 [Caerostris darwini]|uniref:Uncharacterized protein n=1 Tax=Caerostris darwini TaxID=1538125 RepID=A0AAV4MV57_9ARAC|nr:hypothetical protein CDAR_418791 [Caerostris darwini]
MAICFIAHIRGCLFGGRGAVMGDSFITGEKNSLYPPVTGCVANYQMLAGGWRNGLTGRRPANRLYRRTRYRFLLRGYIYMNVFLVSFSVAVMMMDFCELS